MPNPDELISVCVWCVHKCTLVQGPQAVAPLLCRNVFAILICYNQDLLIYLSIGLIFSLFLLSQLGYVIYRRVLRYYSGEEDALGESPFSPQWNMFSLRISSFPYQLPLLSTNIIFIFRYEKSIVSGRREEVRHSPQTANNSRWAGVRLEMSILLADEDDALVLLPLCGWLQDHSCSHGHDRNCIPAPICWTCRCDFQTCLEDESFFIWNFRLPFALVCQMVQSSASCAVFDSEYNRVGETYDNGGLGEMALRWSCDTDSCNHEQCEALHLI